MSAASNSRSPPPASCRPGPSTPATWSPWPATCSTTPSTRPPNRRTSTCGRTSSPPREDCSSPSPIPVRAWTPKRSRRSSTSALRPRLRQRSRAGADSDSCSSGRRCAASAGMSRSIPTAGRSSRSRCPSRKETLMSDDDRLRVLIVEDDSLTAQAHADFVARVPGFDVAATCLSGHEAIERFDELDAGGTPVDIVLLDMNLTDSHGIEVAGRLNARGKDVDIIAITAVRHLQVIRSAISTGITQYLIKPFTFAAFREKLENQREFRRGLGGSGGLATQASVDNALSALRSVSATRLPKGLIAETLEAVSDEVRESAEPVSATEVGQRLELSRVTVRRSLEHLVATKQAIKQPRHGTPGRPE